MSIGSIFLFLSLLSQIIISHGVDLVKGQEFSHLLKQAENSKKVHLISEIVREGRRLEVDEFLDLQTWNQFIQFKWWPQQYESNSPSNSQSKLISHKISFVVLNENIDNIRDKPGGSQEKLFIQYEPYKCKVETKSLDDKDWMNFILVNQNQNATTNSKEDLHYLNIIHSILLPSKNNPYLSLVRNNDDADDEMSSLRWVFGITGLWMKAQFSSFDGDDAFGPKPNSHQDNGRMVFDQGIWNLSLEKSGSTINYYFNGVLLDKPSSNSQDHVNMIEICTIKEPRVLDLINLINVDFKFSERLANNLFRLPIGFDCPSDPRIGADKLKKMSNRYQFDNLESKLVEFEVVARKFEAYKQSSTQVKTISIATSKHPLNSDAPLMMFKIVEDDLVSIRDFNSRLRYNINLRRSQVGHCDIEQLHTTDFKNHQAMDPIEVNFDNGIRLHLNELLLDYIFNTGQEKQAKNFKGKPSQRYLNHIITKLDSSNLYKHEHVIESAIDKSFEHLLSVADDNGKQLLRQMSIVHVYEQLLRNEDSNSSHSSSLLDVDFERGNLYLKRVIIIVYDYKRVQKLAEVRLNLIDTIQPLSFSQKASLYDTSLCFKKDTEVLELVASYPLEEGRIEDYIRRNSDDLMEAFYSTTLKQLDNSNVEEDRNRIRASFNFLRVPHVFSKISHEDGNLELHLLILNKPSPLVSFEKMIESSFVINPETDESLLVKSAEICSEYCEIFKCQMFSFDSLTEECKLSPLPIEYDEQNEWEEGEQLQTGAELFEKQSSIIYYKPVTNTGSSQDATLVELYSFLTHFSFGEDKLEDNNSSNRTTRSINEKSNEPLSFEIQPKFNEFGPPMIHTLEPDHIKLIRVPLTLSMNKQSSMFQVSRSFKTKFQEQRYRPNKLDDWEHVPKKILTSDERTFSNKKGQFYYTLKRLLNIELEICQQMCLDINEHDSGTNSEQVCQSLSYCKFEKECILAIKTDMKFTSSILDLVNEGDITLAIDSLEQLQAQDKTCIIVVRNHLSDFSNGLKLPDNVMADSSTLSLKENLANQGIDMNWRLLFERTSSINQYEDYRDECAVNCLTNKCLAFDYCRFHEPTKTPEGLVRSLNGQSCHLLTISSKLDKAQLSPKVSLIRSRLIESTSLTGNDSKKQNQPVSSKFIANFEANNQIYQCHRYLLSYLADYTHIQQKVLTDNVKNLLEMRTVMSANGLSLDGCAYECSVIVGLPKCIAFEYCSSLIDNNIKIERTCQLIGPQLGSTSSKVAKSRINEETKTDELPSQITNFSSNCHIYLMTSAAKSVDELLISNPEANKNDEHVGAFNVSFILGFVILYLAIGSVIYFYLKKGKPFASKQTRVVTERNVTISNSFEMCQVNNGPN